GRCGNGLPDRGYDHRQPGVADDAAADGYCADVLIGVHRPAANQRAAVERVPGDDRPADREACDAAALDRSRVADGLGVRVAAAEIATDLHRSYVGIGGDPSAVAAGA